MHFHQNGKKLYQISTEVPNGHNICSPSSNKLYQHSPIEGPPKRYPKWDFGLKIYHLATPATYESLSSLAIKIIEYLEKSLILILT
jgi:hypothetical protein